MNALTLIRIGEGGRLARLLEHALAGMSVRTACVEEADRLAGARVLFAVRVDEFGAPAALHSLLRALRSHPGCLDGCVGGVIVDASGELYSKAAAQALVLAANSAGCLFPGKPLVEGTGSLYNQHIFATTQGLSLEQAYFARARALCERVAGFVPPKFDRPKLLMLHASSNPGSNTVWMGRQTLARLPQSIRTQEILLQNGTVQDCRGCSYEACRHFAEGGRCFYGGAVTEQVLPAVQQADGVLLLCPNYNDAVSANMTAFFNRLTNLAVVRELWDKYVWAIVVSGFSGSDLVARQVLGAMCLNKAAILPPRFCLLQTANDPGAAAGMDGVTARLDSFAEHIADALLPEGLKKF